MVVSYSDEVAEHFGNFVRWRRAKLGMNKRRFAQKLGVDPKTVTNLERRASVVGTDDVTVARISEILEVPLEQIMADGAVSDVPQIPPELMNQLSAKADKEGVTVAQFIRAAVQALDSLPKLKRDVIIDGNRPGVFATLAAKKKKDDKGEGQD
jgi:transcriptional regulator with XRE-family HTH domain